MKINVKTPAMLKKLAESAFNSKLKDAMTKLEDASQEAPVQFLLRSEHHFKNGTEGTIFIINLNNAWKKHIKSEGWLKSPEAKKTAIGTCVLHDKKMEIILQKGKMNNSLFQKAVKKSAVLKRFKWSIIEAFTEEEKDLEENISEEDSLETEIAASKQKFKQLTQKYKVINETLKASKKKTEKDKLLKDRNKIIKYLKIECKEWEEIAAEADTDIQQSDDYKTVHKFYQQWIELLKKLKAAKANATDDQEAIALKEEQLYAKALSDIDDFNAYLKGVMEVDVVEESVIKLEKHLNQWKNMTNNGQTAKRSNDFKQLEQRYNDIKNGWAIIKPLLSSWHQYKEEIETLKEKGEPLPETLVQKFIESNQNIQTAL